MNIDWQLDAKCRGMNPTYFEVDNVPGGKKCAGCLVQTECAQFALQPINVSEYIERLTGVPDPEGVDIVEVSGVTMAGIDIE